MQLGALGSAVSSPNGVWSGAPAEIEFGAFYPYNMTFGGSNFTNFHKHEAPYVRGPRQGPHSPPPKAGTDYTGTNKQCTLYALQACDFYQM